MIFLSSVTNVLASVEIDKFENWHYLQFSNVFFQLTCCFSTTFMGLFFKSFGHMGPLVILKFEYTGLMIISMLDFNGAKTYLERLTYPFSAYQYALSTWQNHCRVAEFGGFCASCAENRQNMSIFRISTNMQSVFPECWYTESTE